MDYLKEKVKNITLQECHLSESEFQLFVAHDLAQMLNYTPYKYFGFSGLIQQQSVIMSYKERKGRFSWRELDIFIPDLGFAIELKKGKKRKDARHLGQRISYEDFFCIPVLLLYSCSYPQFQIDLDAYKDNTKKLREIY